MANVKQVKIGSTTYDVEALHFIAGSLDTPAQWKSYIDSLVGQGLQIVEDDPATSGQEPKTAASTTTMGKLYIVQFSGQTESGTYTEFITLDKGAGKDPRYVWEKIGTTAADLTEYLKKGTTYSGAALSAGGHSHTVTVPTVSVETTKKLGATATGTAVGANGTDSFVKSYPGATSKLVTTSVTGVSGTTTASKATAGTAVTVAKRASSQTTVGNANVGTAVSIPNVTASTDVPATNIATPEVTTVKQVDKITAGTAASFTQGSKASWSATVTNGVLSFSFTANGNDSFTANTPTAVTTANVTGVVRSTASTPSAIAVTASKTTLGTAISVTPATTSTTKIYGCGDTASITPYTFEDVDVPVAAEAATTVATGSLSATASGASVMTGLGTPAKADALTGVKVTAQPTITITEAITNTGPVNEHTTVTSNSASTSTDGAHTHDVKVNA